MDVTNGFGAKWKEFFSLLEVQHGLDTNIDAHLWLLHHLFLSLINEDAETWAASWNQHVLSRRGESHQSPHTLFLQGIMEYGQRGILFGNDDNLEGDEIDNYGIDWTDLDNHHIRAHHDVHNTNDGDPTNPFVSNQPDHLSHVEVLSSACPFTEPQLTLFDTQIEPFFPLGADLEHRHLLWVTGLDLAKTIVEL